MATTIIKWFDVNYNSYYHELDLSNDSISLKLGDDVLLHYDCNAKVLKPDGYLYGRFICGASSWLFEKYDGTVIIGNSVDEPDGLIDFEVEISKMYICEQEGINEPTI